MSKMVRRLAAVAVVAVVLAVPGFSFAAAPIEQDPGDSPAGSAGFGDVLYDLWSWIGSLFGSDEATGTGGEEEGGTSGDPPPESNAENEDPPTGGNGDAGSGSDPSG